MQELARFIAENQVFGLSTSVSDCTLVPVRICHGTIQEFRSYYAVDAAVNSVSPLLLYILSLVVWFK